MSNFLSTKIIEFSYNELSKLQIENSSILHIFFILKACGYDRTTFKSVNLIRDQGFIPASNLSKIFTPNEKSPSKYDFISPFSMKKWSNQSPSEKLTKWVSSRIKNNIIGGATTWRSLISDNYEDNSFKFKYNYVSEVKKLTLKNEKINILALAIWVNRFKKFRKIPTPRMLKDSFINEFNLNPEELSLLFKSNSKNVKISLSNNIHDAAYIRDLIGKPENESEEWIKSNLFTTKEEKGNILEEFIMPENNNNDVSTDLVRLLLDRYKQLILMGPPGTSKSYIAEKIASSFNKDSIKKIQFHPSYSYRNFIGGYIVEGKDVKWEDGTLTQLIELSLKNDKKEYLLIIDELNRANVGQVFGETIQCLDRDSFTYVKKEKDLVKYSLPKNLKIIATMNTSDRSIGIIDFAIKRRFISIYTPPNPSIIDELCETTFNISLGDFLRVINERLYKNLKNRELKIGHALFLDENNFDSKTNIFKWTPENFELLFNYKILPIIEDYTKGNVDQINSILGIKLGDRVTGEEFLQELNIFLENEN